MPDGALRILSIGLLALLYLFFLRSMRAVWVETKPTARAPQPNAPRPAAGAAGSSAAKRGSTKKPPALVLIEPVALKGQRFALAAEMTIGRAAGCAIVVDDNFASGVHARVFSNGGKTLAEDLGSTNGTQVNGEPLTGPRVLKRRDRITVGTYVFEADW